MDSPLSFVDAAAFRDWLTNNHATSKGIWLVFAKRGTAKSIHPGDALEEALCFGWIAGQIKSLDDSRYVKRFTPRRKGSNWSEKNRSLAANLIEQGRITDPGLAAIAEAKKRGTWDSPKPVPAGDEQIDLLIQVLRGYEPALRNFQKMAPSVRKTYAMHYFSAKSEDTRARRLAQIIARLHENKKPM